MGKGTSSSVNCVAEQSYCLPQTAFSSYSAKSQHQVMPDFW